MFANIQDWQSNPAQEIEGVPLELGRGRAMILRRAGGANRAFVVALAEVIRGVVGDRDPGEVPDQEIDDQLKSLYADHVVIGWRGFKNMAGGEVPFTRENFLALMEQAPDMWVRIRSAANSRETFQAAVTRKAIERDKEDIKKSSRGKRNGAQSAHV